MGLIYIFPTNENNENDPQNADDRIQITNGQISLKTYGLPPIFWGYLAAILVVFFSMWLATKNLIDKMLNYNDPTLWGLALLVKTILILGPVILLSFYFYEKFLTKKDNELIITHRLFFLNFKTIKLTLDHKDDFLVEHYLDSPNIAKKLNKDELRSFENRGYFELFGIVNNKKFFIDRSSRKADLIKIKDLLSKY
jgi:hypothetical protein